MELGFADVDGVDLGGAVLEQAVDETPGGGTDVHADLVRGGQEGEADERFLELETAAPDEPLGLADAEQAIGGNLVPRLGGGRVVHEHFAGEDEALGFFAAFGEAALDQQDVQAGPLHLPLALRSCTPR